MGSAMWTGGKIAQRLPVDWNPKFDTDALSVDLSPRAKAVVGETADAFRDTPLATQRRVGELIDGLDDRTADWMVRDIVGGSSTRVERTLEYVRRTGADGRDLLDSVGDDARSHLIGVNNRLQRTVVRASDRLQTDRVDDFLAWYRTDLDADERRIVDEAVEASGDDTVEAVASMDDETREILLADGGEALDDVGRAIDDVDPERVEAFLDDAPDASGELLERLGPGDDRRLLSLYEAGEIDGDGLRQFDDLLDSGDMDQADTRRMFEMLETKDADPLIQSSTTAEDILTLGARNSNLEDTLLLVKDSSGRIRWLERGDTGAGWRHVLQRHEGQFYDLPGIGSRADIQSGIYRTIRTGDAASNPSGGIGYIRELPSGDRMTVIVSDNGFIVTAHPGTPSWYS